MFSTGNRATTGRALALGFLIAALIGLLISAAPIRAAVPSGKAYAWGNNYESQLGNGTSGPDTAASVPGAVHNLSGVKSVKAGCAHGLALKNDGMVWAWGFGGAALGNGKTDGSEVPVKAKIEDVKAISAGCSHSLALKENGSVWAWGSNRYGELGNGTNGESAFSSTPVRVADIGTGARAIAAGEYFSLALMKDGTVRSWGDNSKGQLGDGVGVGPFRNTPGPVSNISNVKAIATDSVADHALALLNDGTVKAWGLNFAGQLGDGGPLPGTDRARPGKVAGLKGVRAVATGGAHSLALTNTGRVKSWGYNEYGQLGTDTSGSGTDRSTPGTVTGLENVRSIAGGGWNSLAVLDGGRARSWGSNYYGELGNGQSGDTTHSDVPVGVKNLTNVRNMDGGYGFILAATE